MRRLAVASAILATLLTTPLSLAAALPTTAAPTDATRATAALSFLRSVQLPDGSLAHSIGATSDFVIGAAAAGYDPATLVTCKHTASALGYIAPADKLAGREAEIFAARDRKLAEARERRQTARKATSTRAVA